MSTKTMLKLWIALLKIAGLILKAAPPKNAAPLARSFFHKAKAFVTVWQFDSNPEDKATVCRMWRLVFDVFWTLTMDKEGPAEELDDLPYKELVNSEHRSYLQPALHALWLLEFNDEQGDKDALGHMLKWARLAGVPDAELLKIYNTLPARLRKEVELDVEADSGLEVIGKEEDSDADEEGGGDNPSEPYDWQAEARGDVTARDPEKKNDESDNEPEGDVG